MIKIFVYGSLMTGGRYHQYYLGGKPNLGKAVANGYKKYIFGGGLDGIAPEEGEIVQGEVYEIDEKTLGKLDFFLNNGTIMTRELIDVQMEDGRTMETCAYIWTGSGDR